MKRMLLLLFAFSFSNIFSMESTVKTVGYLVGIYMTCNGFFQAKNRYSFNKKMSQEKNKFLGYWDNTLGDICIDDENVYIDLAPEFLTKGIYN